MVWRRCIVVSAVAWLGLATLAMAATAPAKVVEQFIEGYVQGRFAESRSLTLERANLQTSLFSNWLFGPGAVPLGAADIFLSRKFVQSFRYNITGSTPSGENQTYVTAVRSSPNIAHLYIWALASKRNASPYEIIEAIDTYLTKVNFPQEESRMDFTLIREADAWHISAVTDEKFFAFQQQAALQTPLSAVNVPAVTAAPSSPQVAQRLPGPTTTSTDPGRAAADNQFYATLQGFNRNYQTATTPPPATALTAPVAPPGVATATPPPPEKKSSFLSRLLGFGSSERSDSQIVARISNRDIEGSFLSIREALGRYAASNNSILPGEAQIYDWKSLRQVVNRYVKKNRLLPATEAEAGFSFVSYHLDPGGGVAGDYRLVVELAAPEDGTKRVEVTPYGVDRLK